MLALVPATRNAKFIAYCDEDGALKSGVGMNDLAAHVLDVMGFNVAAFIPFGVRGNVIITGRRETMTAEDAAEVCKLCTAIVALDDGKDDDGDEDGFEDGLLQLKGRFAHLRRSYVGVKSGTSAAAAPKKPMQPA
jgi:hypothetical protein